MHKLQSLVRFSRIFIGTVAFVAVSVSMFTVSETHKDLATVPFGYAFKDRRFNGLVYALHPSGWPSRIQTVVDGKLHGWEIQWYASGIRLVERRYRQGFEHGEQKTWHPDGSPMSWSRYENGIRVGESWGWHADGSTSAFSMHQNGVEIAVKSFSHRQKPFNNYIWADGQRVGLRGDRKCDRRIFVQR